MPTSKGPVSITASATQINLLAPNANRVQASFYNASTATLYLSLGPVATSSLYTVAMAPNSYYELPNTPGGYQGLVTGLWSAVNGYLNVTEIA